MGFPEWSSPEISSGKIAVAGAVCGLLLIMGVIGTEGRENLMAVSTHRSSPVEVFEHMEKEQAIGQGELVPRPASDLNYMSKRKVPNGPDPIHNRRAGNSRQPPGQAQAALP